MELTKNDVPADLAAKIEKVMATMNKTWNEAVIFLLSEVISPTPKFITLR